MGNQIHAKQHSAPVNILLPVILVTMMVMGSAGTNGIRFHSNEKSAFSVSSVTG